MLGDASPSAPDRIDYDAADLNALELEPNRYGTVFAIQSLHHIEALEHLLDQIRASLTPGGLFVVNEYVGPAASSSRKSACRS